MYRGSNMDPIHHDKIVDKLLQYRGKVPRNGQLADPVAQFRADQFRMQIDKLIIEIENFAELIDLEMIQ